MINISEIATILEQYQQEGGDMSPVSDLVQLLSATGKTSLGLNQWVKSDKPLMEDFNEDNRIIDAELCRLDATKVALSRPDAVSWDSGTFDPDSKANIYDGTNIINNKNVITCPVGVKTEILRIRSTAFVLSGTVQVMVRGGQEASVSLYGVIGRITGIPAFDLIKRVNIGASVLLTATAEIEPRTTRDWDIVIYGTSATAACNACANFWGLNTDM